MVSTDHTFALQLNPVLLQLLFTQFGFQRIFFS